MKQDNNLTTVNKFETALIDATSERQPILLPSYGNGEKSMPVALVFSQEFEKDETESALVESDIYEVDADGKIKTERVALEGILIDGKQAFEDRPIVKGQGLKKVRFKTGSKSKVTFSKTILFECSNGKDYRIKVGEGFNEFKKAILKGGKVAVSKAKPLHLTVKFGGMIFSTTSIMDGGIKLSKCFEKKEFKNDLFRDNFCRPLWQQLSEVRDLMSGKPLQVDDMIINCLK